MKQSRAITEHHHFKLCVFLYFRKSVYTSNFTASLCFYLAPVLDLNACFFYHNTKIYFFFFDKSNNVKRKDLTCEVEDMIGPPVHPWRFKMEATVSSGLVYVWSICQCHHSIALPWFSQGLWHYVDSTSQRCSPRKWSFVKCLQYFSLFRPLNFWWRFSYLLHF